MKVQIVLLLLVVVALTVFPLLIIKDSEFGGADGAAEDAIAEVNAVYEPWMEPVIELPGGETESMLFAFQAALGSGVLFFGIGYLKGKCSKPKEAGA